MRLLLALLTLCLLGCGGAGSPGAESQHGLQPPGSVPYPSPGQIGQAPAAPGQSTNTLGPLRTLVLNATALDPTPALQGLDNLLLRESQGRAWLEPTVRTQALPRTYASGDFWALRADTASLCAGYEHAVVLLPNHDDEASGTSTVGFSAIWQPGGTPDMVRLPLGHEFGLNLGFSEDGPNGDPYDLMEVFAYADLSQYAEPWHYSLASKKQAGWT